MLCGDPVPYISVKLNNNDRYNLKKKKIQALRSSEITIFILKVTFLRMRGWSTSSFWVLFGVGLGFYCFVIYTISVLQEICVTKEIGTAPTIPIYEENSQYLLRISVIHLITCSQQFQGWAKRYGRGRHLPMEYQWFLYPFPWCSGAAWSQTLAGSFSFTVRDLTNKDFLLGPSPISPSF